MIGMKVSQAGFHADQAEPKDLVFSSEYYMHSIGQTGLRTLSGSSAEFISHTFPYIPIVIGRGASVSSDATRIRFLGSSGNVARYYALYQGI